MTYMYIEDYLKFGLPKLELNQSHPLFECSEHSGILGSERRRIHNAVFTQNKLMNL